MIYHYVQTLHHQLLADDFTLNVTCKTVEEVTTALKQTFTMLRL